MLELIKEHMPVSSVSMPESQYAVYEYDCIIPDTLPDMAKLLAANASVEAVSVNTSNGSASVNFKINYKILYMPDAGKASDEFMPDTDPAALNRCGIKAFSAFSEHTAVISSELISENTILRASCAAEETNAEYTNSRKIAIHTGIRIEPFILNTAEEGIASGISGADDIQLLKQSITLSVAEDSISDTIIIDEDIELSGGKAAYKELLRTDAVLSDISFSASDGIQIKGTLEVCTLYSADDSIQSIQIAEYEIPFTHSIEAPAQEDDAVWNTNFVLKSCKAEICQDSDGENRILHIEAEIGAAADAYSLRTLEILDDAYSLSQKIVLEKAAVSGMLIADEINGQFVLRDSAAKAENQPDISQVVNVTASFGNVKTCAEDGRIITEGDVICTVLYISDDPEQQAASFTKRVPFTQSFESRQTKAGMSVRADLGVHHISFNIMSPSEVELRISVSAKLTVINQCEFTVASDIVQGEDMLILNDKDAPAILLYVVQPGDTLWKIAKRYNAPLELLKEVNQLKNPDIIMPGQKLLIPR